MLKLIAPCAALAALLATSPASAQNTLVEADGKAIVSTLNLTVDQADDLDVAGPGGTKIGEVEDIVGNDATTPSAVVVDFKGSSGYPDRDIAIPLDQFTLQEGTLVLSTKPSDLASYPEYKD